MRRTSSSLSSTFASLLLLSASSCIVPGASAITFNPVPAPNLDFSSIGRVALAGDFDSISLYQYEGQNQNALSNNGSQSLYTRFPNGAFTTLSAADGYIQTMCPFVTSDGKLQGIVVGGNFTSLGGVQSTGVALFNPNNSQIVPLTGIEGTVSAVYCDQPGNTVYVGGSFRGGNSTNAIAWVTGWTNLPFAGFNKPVTSITKGSNGNIIFGGSFDSLGNASSSVTPENADQQVIPVTSANISVSLSTTQTGFNDPRSIICKTASSAGSGNTWLLPDRAPGFWRADFQFGFNPTKLMLSNANVQNRGVKTWRFTALPDTGIMNFTYFDQSGKRQYCDANCPLANNASAQSFSFVNPNVGMNGFRIDISDWYGDGAGLSGIELFQDDIYTYAINDFNEPTCDGVSQTSAKSTATPTGLWKITPSGQTYSEYLTATFTDATINPQSGSVTFQPNIKQSGNYSVMLYTPGCQGDGTCGTRGRINITGNMASSSQNGQTTSAFQSVELFQTNNFDKYDQIYYGYVDASSSGFQPSITLAPQSGQSGPLTVVAQRIRFELLNPASSGLNGLFEYNPNQAVVDTDFSKSAIDRAGQGLNKGALVNQIAVVGQTVYAAGNFSTSNFSNVFSVGSDNATSLAAGGLNSEVLALYQNGSMLYFGGNFTNTRQNDTAGLSGVAAYSTTNNKWQALGTGVNGVVSYIVPFSLNITANQPETVLAISGSFTQINAFGSNTSATAQGIAVWVPSRLNWLQNVGLSTISLQGQLVATSNIPGSSTPLFAGAVSSQQLSASDGVGLTSSSNLNLQQLPVRIQAQSTTTGNQRKRYAPQNGRNITGAVTGLMYSENNLNITILGGHFTAQATNGSTINNLLFANGSNANTVSGLTSGVDSSSAFLALGALGTTLFAGGQVTGNVNGATINNIVAFDLSRGAYVSPQPAGLTGSNAAVYAVAPRPSSNDVYVGGNFDSAGSLGCPSVCVYSNDRSQWNSPGTGLTGSVSSLVWVSNTHLILGGNLTVGTNFTGLAKYDANARTYTEFSSSSTPGPVTALCPANSDGSQFWAAGTASNGSAFISRFDGTQWRSIGYLLGTGTVVQGLQVFSLTQNHANTDLLAQNQALLVMGTLNIPNFGNASAALFNGTTFTPFVLSTSNGQGGGSISQAFVQNPQNFFQPGGHKLALGFIVLIGLAIALVLVFLLVVAGIIAERIRRKREGYVPANTNMFGKGSNVDRIPPEHLFGNLSKEPRSPGL